MLTASDQPVHIWARPYFQGKPTKAGSNPSRVYPAGNGEALGWFFPVRSRHPGGRSADQRGQRLMQPHLRPFRDRDVGWGGLTCVAILLPELAHKLFAAKRV
ncbi:MAG: hypothetical protein KGO02_22595 [Alphaproteobacteria bacterium]|nr:hypothetical protein [Alphaproteobacteria bacterium]